MRPSHRTSVSILVLALLPGGTLAAQSLRGSPSSVARMYDAAVREDLTFYETVSDVAQAKASGDLVRLPAADADFAVHRVSFPYVLPNTLAFVRRLAERYESACHEPMIVTSAVRPENRQPRNSSQRSVHPTGMAVDLRRPEGRCLTWLRKELLSLEANGAIEATEERRPAHFHVAVLDDSFSDPSPTPTYANATVADISSRRQPLHASTTSRASTRSTKRGAARSSSRRAYTVRRGDSLWLIARRNDTTVDALKRANRLARTTVVPGQRIVVP